MRFRIRRNHSIHPFAYRDGRSGVRLGAEEDDWPVRHAAPATPPPPPPQPLPHPEAQVTPPPPFLNGSGLRAQATAVDARAERLIRSVRMELADLKQAIDSWGEARDDMLDLDLEAVRQDPDAAATLPPAALARALAAAAARIRELEAQVDNQQREEAALREELARLRDDHAYTRGRLETLHEVIGALHGNLEDLRFDRDHHREMREAPRPRALHAGEADFPDGTRDQRWGDPFR